MLYEYDRRRQLSTRKKWRWKAIKNEIRWYLARYLWDDSQIWNETIFQFWRRNETYVLHYLHKLTALTSCRGFELLNAFAVLRIKFVYYFLFEAMKRKKKQIRTPFPLDRWWVCICVGLMQFWRFSLWSVPVDGVCRLFPLLQAFMRGENTKLSKLTLVHYIHQIFVTLRHSACAGVRMSGFWIERTLVSPLISSF